MVTIYITEDAKAGRAANRAGRIMVKRMATMLPRGMACRKRRFVITNPQRRKDMTSSMSVLMAKRRMRASSPSTMPIQ